MRWDWKSSEPTPAGTRRERLDSRFALTPAGPGDRYPRACSERLSRPGIDGAAARKLEPRSPPRPPKPPRANWDPLPDLPYRDERAAVEEETLQAKRGAGRRRRAWPPRVADLPTMLLAVRMLVVVHAPSVRVRTRTCEYLGKVRMRAASAFQGFAMPSAWLALAAPARHLPSRARIWQVPALRQGCALRTANEPCWLPVHEPCVCWSAAEQTPAHGSTA